MSWDGYWANFVNTRLRDNDEGVVPDPNDYESRQGYDWVEADETWDED